MCGNEKHQCECLANALFVATYATKFSLGHWSFLGLCSETEWNTTDTFKLGREWDRVAKLMMSNLRESGHTMFCASSALDRGQLKIKGGRKILLLKRILALLFLSVSSVSTGQSQICVWNSVTPLTSSEKTYAVMEQSESNAGSADLLNIQRPLQTSEQAQGNNLLHNHKERVQNLFELRAIDQVVYRCRICQNSCLRTILHDERC